MRTKNNQKSIEKRPENGQKSHRKNDTKNAKHDQKNPGKNDTKMTENRLEKTTQKMPEIDGSHIS